MGKKHRAILRHQSGGTDITVYVLNGGSKVSQVWIRLRTSKHFHDMRLTSDQVEELRAGLNWCMEQTRL